MDIAVEDARAVMALVREVCDRWDDPRAWREHLLLGACRLLKGNVGTVTAQQIPRPGELGQPIPLAIVGMSEETKKNIYEVAIQGTRDRSFAEVDQLGAPGLLHLFTEFQRQGSATQSRAEMVDDATYYASDFHNGFRKHAGCDDYIMSVRTVDEPGRIEVLMVDRPPGALRFTPREVQILKLLHDEISPLIGVRLTTEEHLSRDGLSGRLRDTLAELLEGHSEKEIAGNLGISGPTVHEYIGLLYRHFHVRSRAELMAYFVARQPRLAPRSQ